MDERMDGRTDRPSYRGASQHLTDLLKPPSDFPEAPSDLLEPPSDFPEAPSDFPEPPSDHFEPQVTALSPGVKF